MAPKSAKMAPKRVPNAAKMAILARFRKLLEPIFHDFGGLLAVRLDSKKEKYKKHKFLKVFLKIWGPE